MPAQSPTLSPTLSAIVAALRGSSSGMPCSTLPTRSAPTSAALVKMPPPTRMNIASSAAPKPKPSSTVGASLRKISTTSAPPNRPRPTVRKPTTPPVRKAMPIAVSRPPCLTGRRGHPQVGPGRERHARAADERAEDRADDEEQRTADLDPDLVVGVVHRQEEEQDDRDHHEDRERLELAEQVRRRAFLHGAGDLLHVLGAPAGLENRLDEHRREAERDQREDQRDDDECDVRTTQGHSARGKVIEVPDINVLLYNRPRPGGGRDRPGRIPVTGETTTGSRGRGTRSSS